MFVLLAHWPLLFILYFDSSPNVFTWSTTRDSTNQGTISTTNNRNFDNENLLRILLPNDASDDEMAELSGTRPCSSVGTAVFSEIVEKGPGTNTPATALHSLGEKNLSVLGADQIRIIVPFLHATKAN